MDTRTRILDAALALAAEGGLRELTQPRVAGAAGVRQSHLTYYFPTVADLLEAVARHTVDTLVAELGRESVPPSRRGVVARFAAATSDKRRVRTMLTLVAAADREPALRPRLREYVGELRGGIGAALRASGIAVADADIAFIHTVIAGTAVLQLARDNAQARREARAVLERAIAVLDRES